MNFKVYKTNARYAEQINAGYSERLNGIGDPFGGYDSGTPESAAFHHGYMMADRHEQTNRSEK